MQESVYTAEVYTAKITSLHLKRFLLEKKIVQIWWFVVSNFYTFIKSLQWRNVGGAGGGKNVSRNG